MLSVEELRSHVGRRVVSTDVAHAGPANLLRLALGRGEPELQVGDPLPPGWHGLYFLPRFGPAELRPDGSPLDTGVIPSMKLPRRMFAGERLRFHRPIRVGDALRRETELADIAGKTGSTGTLVFATVVQSIFVADGVALEEERRTVFREEAKVGEGNQAPRREEAPTEVPWRRRVVPNPVLLFRFARDHNPGRTFVSYATQARAPLFDTAPFELRARPAAAGGCELWAVTPAGTVAMSATAEFA